MKQRFEILTSHRDQLIDITSQVQKAVQEKLIQEGFCLIYTPHTTAGITINENADPDVRTDLLSALNRIVPENGYRHAEGNSQAHVKSSLLGCSQQVLIEKSRLQLGTWQGIYFCEFDGPRTREFWVSIFPKGDQR